LMKKNFGAYLVVKKEIDRLNKDLCFDIEEAKKDFDYNPHIFLPNKDLLNDL